MALARVVQEDFAAGMVRSVAPHLIPENGVYDAVNSLTRDDGSLERRGGSTYLPPADFGVAGGLTFLWEGPLAAGKRTVIANAVNFGVVSEDGSAFIDLGFSGLDHPARAIELNGALFIDSGHMYAGSLKSTPYATGTVQVTNGSKSVVGSGTTWNTLVDAGMFFEAQGHARSYIVEEIVDTTHLTLRDEYQGSGGSGKTYELAHFRQAPFAGEGFAALADRLIWWQGGKLFFTHSGDWGTHDETDYHELFGGPTILGAHHLRDSLLVFASNGVWVISGMAYDLTDDFGTPQHRLEHAHPELIVWRKEGIAAWENALIVPMIDGLWLLDGISTPRRLTDSLGPFYTDYVEQGYRLGLATVTRNHYMVPVLGSTDDEDPEADELIDFLVCRLNRPTEFRAGVLFPWTRFNGFGAHLGAVAQRYDEDTREPEIVGAHREVPRLVQLHYFEPDEGATDADGSEYPWEPVTRDFATGKLNTNLVRRVRARYELDQGDIRLAEGDGRRVEGVTEWGLFDWGGADWFDPSEGEWRSVAGAAPPAATGRVPYAWRVNRHRRFMRLRLRSSGSPMRLVLRSLELFIRPSAKDR